MQSSHPFIVTTIALAVFSTALLMSASGQVTTTGNTQTTAYTVNTSNDLLLTSVTSHVDQDNGATITDTNSKFTFSDSSDTGTAVGAAALADGTFGAIPVGANGGKNRSDYAGIVGDSTGLGLTVTYNLNLTAQPAGYSFSEVDIYTAWNNNGRSAINVGIYYATVAAPTTFTLLTTATYAGGATTPVANEAIVTNGSGAPLATGVSSIQFYFPNQQNSGVGYREISVINAVPEPGTWRLLAVGGFGWLVPSRRRRRAARLA